jgi:cell wall-associated NlpC family hydrolase
LIALCGILLSSCAVKKKQRVLRSATQPELQRDSKIKETRNRSLTAYYADMLNVNEKALNPDLFTFIDQWMGSPHRLGGMTPDGIDCSGFVNLAYSQVYHKNLPRTSRDMAETIKRKYDHQLKEGDLVFFSFGGKAIDHVGIYLHNDKFVHVSTKQGVVISNLKDTWYYKYLTRCGTPKG